MHLSRFLILCLKSCVCSISMCCVLIIWWCLTTTQNSLNTLQPTKFIHTYITWATVILLSSSGIKTTMTWMEWIWHNCPICLIFIKKIDISSIIVISLQRWQIDTTWCTNDMILPLEFYSFYKIYFALYIYKINFKMPIFMKT